MTVPLETDPRKEGRIWVMDMSESSPVITPRIPATFRRVGMESAHVIAEVMGPGSLNEILRRFAAGRWCYTATTAGQLAAYGWVSFGEEYVGELNLWIHMQPDEAYIWDCVTRPDFQNRHFYSALLSHILQELRAEPLRRVWIGANLDNLPSQKGIARAGFQPVAEMAIQRVLALRQVWVVGMPGVSESLVAEARRVFLDNRDQIWLKAVKVG